MKCFKHWTVNYYTLIQGKYSRLEKKPLENSRSNNSQNSHGDKTFWNFCAWRSGCMCLFELRLSPGIWSGVGLLTHMLVISSVLLSRSVVSDSLRPHELQDARPPCPSPIPRVHANPCQLSRWSHPTISSSVISFSSCPQYFPASGSFQISQLFASGGQIIGVSASKSVLPMNTQDWSPLGWTGWISLQSKGLSRVFSNTTVQKHQFFGAQLSSQPNSHINTWQWKNHSLD